MANSKFSLDGPAFEHSTQLIRPDHIMPIQEEAGVDIQILHEIPVLPAPPEEQDGKTGDDPENSLVLRCILEDASDPLHAFQEYEHYCFGDNSVPDSDVPEDDDFTDEMEDDCIDEDELVLVSLQEKEEGPPEEDHGLPSPGNIPVDKLPSEKEEPIATSGDHDQPSRPGNIQQEEEEVQAGDAQENSLVLRCILEETTNPLHTFQEYEHYCFGDNSGPDSDAPEDDDFTDEMEDKCIEYPFNQNFA